MKGYNCSVAAAVKLGKIWLLVLLLLPAILSFQAQGAMGMRHKMYAVQGGAAKPDLNYGTDKRRVPNGSDPIHNRRAGKSGEPPAV